MAHPFWPLFDLRVRTPRLELRVPTDDDLVALAELAAAGIHEPGTMPFLVPWSTRPSPDLERGVLQWNWRQRAEWTPESWHLGLVTVCEGDVVGMQGIHATAFARVRAVETGSWLGRARQGRGIGREMRAAVLHLAFAGLGADVAYSGAYEDNDRSIAVSRSVGYEDNGDRVTTRGEDGAGRELLFKLTRTRWEATRSLAVQLEGVDACLELFGAGRDGAPPLG